MQAVHSPDISRVRGVHLQDAHLETYDQMCDTARGGIQGRPPQADTFATANP